MWLLGLKRLIKGEGGKDPKHAKDVAIAMAKIPQSWYPSCLGVMDICS